MSRRLLLAAGGPLTEIPDPVDPPDPEPNPDWPATDDPAVLAARPHGHVLSMLRVGGVAQTHASVGAASTAFQQTQIDDGRQDAISWLGDPGPDYRCDVLVTAGTYSEAVGWGGWGNLVGIGATSADTVVRGSGEAGGVVHTFGSMHLENLTLESAVDGGNLSPKYALHMTGSEQVTAVHVTFDVVDAQGSSNWLGGGVLGADFIDGSYGLWYGCTMRGEGGQEGNLHGPADGGGMTEGVTVCFIDCTYEGGLSGPQYGGAAPAGGTNSMYVIGGTMTQINASTGTHVYTDLDVPVVGGGTVTRGVTSWPQPVAGLAGRWSDFYTPSSIGDEPHTFTPTVTDAAPMTPVTGRTYITHVVPDKAMHATRVGCTGATAGGAFGGDIRKSRNALSQPATDWLVTVGLAVAQPYYYVSRYPGDGFWTALRFTTDVSVKGSASLPGQAECYYTDDGTTFVPVTAGTAHPLPFIRATA